MIYSSVHNTEWYMLWQQLVQKRATTDVHVFVEGVKAPDAPKKARGVHLHCLDDTEVYGWVALFWVVQLIHENKRTEAQNVWDERVLPTLHLQSKRCPKKESLVAEIQQRWVSIPRPKEWTLEVEQNYSTAVETFCTLPSPDKCRTLLKNTINQDLRNGLWVEMVRKFQPAPCVLLVGNDHVGPLWRLFSTKLQMMSSISEFS